jgi:peptide/nickel transport system permease protein
MAKYLVKRLASALITLFGITVIDYILMNLAGDPVRMMAGPKANAAALALKAQELGMDKPVIVRYFRWLKQVLQGNLGISYKTYQPVSEMIQSHLGSTLVLMGSALAVSLAIALIFGIYSAVHQHSRSDYAIVSLAFLGQSIPSFFLALLLVYVFSVELGWLPSTGMRDLTSPGTGVQFRYLILPMLVLAFSEAGNNIRYIRSAVLEILNKDYMRTARGKGIGRRLVILKHGLRNALIPILTVIGMEIPGLFGGSIIIEQIFSWPGLGLMTMSAVLSRDVPVIMGACLLSAVVVLLSNLLVDILYALADPTIRLQ